MIRDDARRMVEALRLGETCDMFRAESDRRNVRVDRRNGLALLIAEALIDACAWDEQP